MKILTVLGARPQFVKAAIVSEALRDCDTITEIILHTGQHYDHNMSEVFFDELNIPKPDKKLELRGGSHALMTGHMLIEIEQYIMETRPDQVLVYGDTNSTLAGSLAASKLNIPVVHVEAGLRSFNMQMPEEINRILTDQLSSTLFCPTDTAMQNLFNEGFKHKNVEVLKSGDVMKDMVNRFENYLTPPNILLPSSFAVATIHRAENTDSIGTLKSIVDAINYIHREVVKVVIPLHPRTRRKLIEFDLTLEASILDPVGYLKMLWLLKHSELVLTDSGGLQKEAFMLGKRCLTLREQTEWVELVDLGVNTLVGADTQKIIYETEQQTGLNARDETHVYGDGNAAKKIAMHMSNM